MGKHRSARPSLLPSRLVSQHVKSCHTKEGKCGLCFWQKKKSIWLKELKSKWLHAALRGKVCRLGCSICSLAEAGGPWACFEQKPLEVRLHHLKRHESSKGHQEAIAKHQGVQSAGFAPDLQLFQDSLHRMRSGGSARDGGVYSDKKQQIRWCLAEAVMDKGRQILRDASAIAVTRDERKGRLLIRWRACTPNLTSASGVLSFHPVDGSAEDLAESTKKAVQEYCRLRICLPRGFKDPQPGEDDPAAEANIKKKTGILVTDGAAPEVLASGLLSGRRPYAKSSSCETYMEGVKVISRDTPHASTRLLKRPFKASPELDKLMTEYVSGTDSFAQKVFHSPMLTTWWKELVTEDNDGLTSMCAAKHRFASYFIPLSRIAHNFPSVVKLCQKVAIIRASGGEWASHLLQQLSGKKCLLVAMAADAAASVHELTRSFDDESSDVSETNARIENFALGIQALFHSERVFELPTFTKTLCDSFARSPLHFLHHGNVMEIAITEHDKTYAIKVMKARLLCRRVFFLNLIVIIFCDGRNGHP